MGCGCNNNFNAAKKPCTCGRNAGGNCQCNQTKMNASGDSLAKRLVNQKKQFSKFMGEEYRPHINVREFGFDGDSYYEFNDKYSMYRGINKSDLITDF